MQTNNLKHPIQSIFYVLSRLDILTAIANRLATIKLPWASLLAMNDNAVYAGSTLSSARFTANSASMMIC
ncbi:hypothetical protein OKW12_004259 [Pseudomonas silensiensis]|nr:hypothetical protein [Pseudomonas silensiensis]